MLTTRFSKSAGITSRAEEAGQYHDLRLGGEAAVEDRPAEVLKGEILPSETTPQGRPLPGRTGGRRPRPAGDHQADLGVQPAGGDPHEQVLQRAPAAGNRTANRTDFFP